MTQKRTPNILTRNTVSEVLGACGSGRHPPGKADGKMEKCVRGEKEEGWLGPSCAFFSCCQAGSWDGVEGGHHSLECLRG